jgi:hypothetical protein
VEEWYEFMSKENVDKAISLLSNWDSSKSDEILKVLSDPKEFTNTFLRNTNSYYTKYISNRNIIIISHILHNWWVIELVWKWGFWENEKNTVNRAFNPDSI